MGAAVAPTKLLKLMNDYDNFGTCDLTAMKHGLCNYSERHTCPKEVGVVVVRGKDRVNGEGVGGERGRRGVQWMWQILGQWYME